ncbi:MBL fold metallo-hydrolase [Virgibacillus sp. DJP39]|uniref:MBL fold metallo-hydrolase n=1 Tax=Virgibacillus sp. DJP39 TaxID=3409790 RepID=UPI003BB78EBB
MEIHFLGTGSAYPGANRDNTSLCIVNNRYSVLVDVSGNPSLKLKQIGVELVELDAVIFTHFHIDHIYGLPSLLWGMWLENRVKLLTIYCDHRNEAKLNEWLVTMEAEKWAINFPIVIETFNGNQNQELIACENMQMSCFPALHSVPTIGLEIKCDNKLIIYSGDSEINSRIQTYKHIDVLIHEATSAINAAPNHTSLTQLTEAYELNAIKDIVLVHLSDNEPYEEKLTGKIKLAEEMMCITIS